VRREPIFYDNLDRERLLMLLEELARRFRWRCHAYCLMTNHYHLVVETPEANLSAGMHRLNLLYAKQFNARYGHKGHLVDDRYFAILVDSDWHLLDSVRYVVLNPVRANLCHHPGGWIWSSYRAVVGLAPAPTFLTLDRVLAYFGSEPSRARHGFRTFVQDGLTSQAA
jgi:putative transposase